jgi:arginyl-tRNA synthetase
LSILRKAAAAGIKTGTWSLNELTSSLKTPEESALIGTLARLSEALERTLDQRKPSQLAG